jgi:Ca-activated chloride channel family protein
MTNCQGGNRPRRPRHKLLWWPAVLVFVAGAGPVLQAQSTQQNIPPKTPQKTPQTTSEQTQAQAPRFSINSNLVRLLVSVRDRQTGAIVTNLSKEDFEINDNNVSERVAVFERNTSLPLSIAILVDTSASTRKDLSYETSSILKFLRAVKQAGNADDALAVYSFNWQVRMEVGYTRSEQRAERVMKLLHGDGGTSLYDAVYLVSQDLSDREGRHVMVVVTDGGDTTSYKKFDDAVKSSLTADVVMYPIVVIPIENNAGRNLGGEHALETMARSTGGNTFFPSGAGELDGAFGEILRALRTQYLIGYYPVNSTGKRQYHSVKVTTKDARYAVTARSGYYEP